MGAQFLNLDVPAGDGVGAETDVSALQRSKLISVAGSFLGELIIEARLDNAVGSWVPVLFFRGDDDNRLKPLDATLRWLRVRRRQAAGGVPSVSLGGLEFPSPAIAVEPYAETLVESAAVNRIEVPVDFARVNGFWRIVALIVRGGNDGVNGFDTMVQDAADQTKSVAYQREIVAAGVNTVSSRADTNVFGDSGTFVNASRIMMTMDIWTSQNTYPFVGKAVWYDGAAGHYSRAGGAWYRNGQDTPTKVAVNTPTKVNIAVGSILRSYFINGFPEA